MSDNEDDFLDDVEVVADEEIEGDDAVEEEIINEYKEEMGDITEEKIDEHAEEIEKDENAFHEEHEGEEHEEEEYVEPVEFNENDLIEIFDEIISGFGWSGGDEEEEVVYSTLRSVTSLGPFGTLSVALDTLKGLISPLIKRITKDEWKKRLGTMNNGVQGAAAFLTIIGMMQDDGAEERHREQIAKLQEIVDKLGEVNTSIQEGFSSLIAHDDFRDFRENVVLPTQEVWGRLMRSFSVCRQHAVDDFVNDCDGDLKNPGNLLNRLIGFLSFDNNLIATQLEANSYSYSSFKIWYDIFTHHATKLLFINHCYNGFKHKDDEEFQKNDLRHQINTTGELIGRLEQIEVKRQKDCHEKGINAEKLKKIFDEIKEEYPGRTNDWGSSFLPNAAKALRDKWKDVNGSDPLYLAVIRGHHNREWTGVSRMVDYHIGDPSKVTFVPNVAYDSENGFLASDGVCVVLIQPFTPEMKQHHDSQRERQKNRVVALLNKKFNGGQSTAMSAKLSAFRDDLLKLTPDKPPLVAIFSNDQFTGRSPRSAGVCPFAYRMVGEASTAAKDEQMLMVEIHMHQRTPGHMSFLLPIRFLLQIVF